MDDLLKYMSANDAFPANAQNQSVYEIYWSQAQMRARQHENMYVTQKALLGLWHVTDQDREVHKTLISIQKGNTKIDSNRLPWTWRSPPCTSIV